MDKLENSEQSSIGHFPNGKWCFDDAVTNVFGDMLRRSIPDYDCMRQVVYEVGSRCVQKDTHLVDLGCSTGESLEPFVTTFGDNNRYVGVDTSKPMINAARNRFASEISKGLVEIKEFDLKHSYPEARASLTLSILSMQFIPIELRQRLVSDIYSNTVANGAFIMVEKVLGESDEINSLMTNWYEKKKQNSGYTLNEIIKKRESLEGVLVPLKASWNMQLLRDAGFKKIDYIWRCMNFAGWIAIK